MSKKIIMVTNNEGQNIGGFTSVKKLCSFLTDFHNGCNVLFKAYKGYVCLKWRKSQILLGDTLEIKIQDGDGDTVKVYNAVAVQLNPSYSIKMFNKNTLVA
tara:strand:+ start:454 stop:756 length:303 start_codon:yes stop_codon:yes gene_type:complete